MPATRPGAVSQRSVPRVWERPQMQCGRSSALWLGGRTIGNSMLGLRGGHHRGPCRSSAPPVEWKIARGWRRADARRGPSEAAPPSGRGRRACPAALRRLHLRWILIEDRRRPVARHLRVEQTGSSPGCSQRFSLQHTVDAKPGRVDFKHGQELQVLRAKCVHMVCVVCGVCGCELTIINSSGVARGKPTGRGMQTLCQQLVPGNLRSPGRKYGTS